MIILTSPEERFLDSYNEAFEEYQKLNIDSYFFSNSKEYDIFEKFRRYESGNNLPAGRVGSKYFWLVDDENDYFIGEISIRYTLTPELLRYGGNIGYGVRFAEWGKGYGTMMLREALIEAKKIGLEKVLITCDDQNIASARVMEINGFVLDDKIENIIRGKRILTRRYWKTI